ncbi:site-specific DNA-methyltransferase [Cloacibacillus sp.]|uniref:site-specific DNA-methyltransferase n=1 Tax=Cloacibacillus sp. TaxID=2049023 RepID=UPI0025BFB7B1|nr:site-specific DNA-methyltransferase [Cloacibacillus sp.]MCC8056876.1 site-specific DNA-methyltransferase [Cloacibacillus sp.]
MTNSEKLEMRTPSLADANFAALAALFPNAISETIDESGAVVRAIDKDVLAQEINAHVVEGREERYQFTWPDKRKSILLANAPIAAALRPCREESLDFDTTENLYIEGDNLDVLKLLRETYLNRVKMIYIDPPYNTSNDFIYNDDFTEDSATFLSRDGQYDEQGNRLVLNTDSNGRFHTDWLNMIYPHLRLAKDLLRDDGAVFISCDDNEVNNLRKICDDIFGASNFISQVIVQTNPRGRTFDRFIAKMHEYIIVYSKNIGFDALREIPKDDKAMAGYQKEDSVGKYRLLELRNRNPVFNRTNRPLMFYPFYADPDKLDVSLSPTERHTVEIYPRNSEGVDGCWTWGLEKATNEINLLVANLANTGKWSVFRKDYLEGTSLFTKAKGLWLEKEMNHENGKEMVRELFGFTPFDFPKSVDYIKKCLLLGTSSYGDNIVMDFFSGSATTAHAVMQLNAEDGGKRKFIMVQLPEVCAEGTEAGKAGYKTICEIGKERIRRAGAKIKTDSPLTTQDLDVGFRVLKLDSSNMKDVYYTPEEFLTMAEKQHNLFGFMDNIKEDRSDEDLLFQVMLDLGIPLSAKITQDGDVFYVNDTYLIACFKRVDTALITEIAQKKPYYAVFRDASFASDSAMVNFEQVFNTYSPNTIRRVL